MFLNLYLRFNLSTLLIFFKSNPPNLIIFGLLLTSTIVDSNPTIDLPPLRIYFILLPNSSSTSLFVTGLMLEDIFALGAANGKLIFLKSNLAIGCLGNLTATVFLLFVTFFDISLSFFNFKINVIGPGENFLNNLLKYLFK